MAQQERFNLYSVFDYLVTFPNLYTAMITFHRPRVTDVTYLTVYFRLQRNREDGVVRYIRIYTVQKPLSAFYFLTSYYWQRNLYILYFTGIVISTTYPDWLGKVVIFENH